MRITAVLLLVTATATAQVINTNDLAQRMNYPTRIGATFNPSTEMLRDAGWREYVPCPNIEGSNIVLTSYSDNGDTVTASCEYEEVVVTLPLPDLFDNGIAVLDDDGHAIELVPVGSEVIAVQVSNSPLDPVVRERLKREAKRADREARQAWRDDNRLLSDRIATNRADVAAIEGTNAQQLNQLRKELDDALQNINQLRRLVAELRKEQ